MSRFIVVPLLKGENESLTSSLDGAVLLNSLKKSHLNIQIGLKTEEWSWWKGFREVITEPVSSDGRSGFYCTGTSKTNLIF